MPGPLRGIRVVDFTATILGPLAGQILGDMGADVIKVEPPAGDTLRSVGAKRSPLMGALFLQLNRNKRSVALDLRRPAALAAMWRLIERADVLLYAYRPSAMRRLGLDYEAVAARNPQIVYCGAFGFGQGGRYADLPAYDDLIQGASGVAAQLGRHGMEPHYVPFTMADRIVGLSAASAVGMALFERERSGRGQAIDVPMFETVAQLTLGDHLNGLTFEPPFETAGYERMLDANRRPHRTQDSYICLLPYTNEHWGRLFALVGRPELTDDPRFASPGARNASIDVLYGFLAEVIATRPTAAWLEALREADIPAGPLNALETLIDDPHLAEVGFLPIVEHPTEGTLRLAGIPSTWSRTQPEIERLAPRLGEHTVEVLHEVGLADDVIAALLADAAAIDGRDG